jgi:hypothetical protein
MLLNAHQYRDGRRYLEQRTTVAAPGRKSTPPAENKEDRAAEAQAGPEKVKPDRLFHVKYGKGDEDGTTGIFPPL